MTVGVLAGTTTVPTVRLSDRGERGPSGGRCRRAAARHERQPPDVRERARRYLAAIPPAVAGNHGDAATFRVCCRLVRGFALDDEDALEVLTEWNRACTPPWSEEELRAKLEGARRYGRETIGGLLSHPSVRS